MNYTAKGGTHRNKTFTDSTDPVIAQLSMYSNVLLVPTIILVLVFIPFLTFNFSFYSVLVLKIILVIVFIRFLTFNFSFYLVLVLK